MPKEPQPKRKQIPQVCVIPFRHGDPPGREPEFCLITSLVKKRWIFPKGIIDPGETPHESAHKEVWEEAGLRGTISGDPLGQFADAKWGCDLQVQVVMMQVGESAEVWPEVAQRQREWVAADEAMRRLGRRELREFLRRALDRLTKDLPAGDASTRP